MFYLVIRQFALTLRNLDAIMAKAQQYAQARKFDVNNFCNTRFFPDMLPFSAQIRVGCDHAKNAAGFLAGREPPVHEDNEVTFQDLRGRVAKCLAYLDGFTAQDFERTTADTIIKLPRQPGKGLRASDFLFAYRMPNFFFHVTTAYDLLRHGGLEVGKKDLIGQLNLVDA
jgi:uncharacterized protein